MVMMHKDRVRLRRTLRWLRTVGIRATKKETWPQKEAWPGLSYQYKATYAGYPMRLTVAILFNYTWIRLGLVGGFNFIHIHVNDIDAEQVWVLDWKQNYNLI